MRKSSVLFGLASAAAFLVGFVAGVNYSGGEAGRISRLFLMQKRLRASKVDVPYGCLTYEIDESSLEDVADVANVRFAQLGKWAADEHGEFPPAPVDVAALQEKEVYIVGFMYPLESGAEISKFKLMRLTQTCCWGPQPEYNQFVLVIMSHKVKFERIKPVAVLGKFFVECKPVAGYIYRMAGSESAAVVEEAQVKAIDYASLEEKGIPRLDLALMEKLLYPELNNGRIENWPKEVLELEGKTVFAEGYIVYRFPPPIGSKNEKIVLSIYPNTEDAGLTSSVFIRFKEEQEVPPLWAGRAAVTGEFMIHRYPHSWGTSGIIMLHLAVNGVPE